MKIKIFSTIIILLIAICCYINKPINNYQGFVFGTYYNIKLETRKNLLSEVEKVFDEVNNTMSVFKTESEINKLNNNLQIDASPELLSILTASEQVYNESNGAFDVSIGELVELWGFGKNREKDTPTEKQIEEVLSYSGFDKVKIKDNIVIKDDIRLKINLSAIAKGYAVDKVAEILDNNRVKNYLIDIGGEIKASGLKKNKPWRIGLANPLNPSENKMTFELNNTAIATSGDYQNFHIKDGVKYSHTIDTATGKPVLSNLVSVSVVNDSCMMADAYATAIMAMGYSKGIDFAKRLNLKVILIKNDGNVFSSLY
ncbi:MAG: FAD:protein FMN transferase [Alphaproteobacteria bacterium]